MRMPSVTKTIRSPGFEGDLAGAIGAVREQAERKVHGQVEAVTCVPAGEVRRDVAGIDQVHRSGAQVEAADQARDEVLERAGPRARPAPRSSRRPARAGRRPRCARCAGFPRTGWRPGPRPPRDPWRRSATGAAASRARLKSNVSPAMPAAGSSQPARVKAPASQVCGPGSSRCWISADRLNGRVRWPHSYRSVCRRLAITTNPSRCASRAISSVEPGDPAPRGG